MKKKENIENKEELLKFAVVNHTGEDYIKTFDKKGTGFRWVKWGEDNKMPDFLYDA